jgi:hypothetical protein
MEFSRRWGWKALHWTTRLLLVGLCLFWILVVGILAFSYREGGMHAVDGKIVHLYDSQAHLEAASHGPEAGVLMIHRAYQLNIKLLLFTWALSWLNTKVHRQVLRTGAGEQTGRFLARHATTETIHSP